MNDLEIMMLVAVGIKALPKLPNDPDDSLTVSLTRRELTLLAAINPLVALSYPDLSQYILPLDTKLRELVEVQKPHWLVGADGSSEASE